VITVPSYPFVLEDPSDVSKECWVPLAEASGQPQAAADVLFFTCHLTQLDPLTDCYSEHSHDSLVNLPTARRGLYLTHADILEHLLTT
jgi:hypothetical protein